MANCVAIGRGFDAVVGSEVYWRMGRMGPMALGLLLALFLWPGLSAAQVNPDAFEVDTTGQLLEACTWSESDPLHVRMVTFCLGYVSSAIQYDTAVNDGDPSRMITCPPASATLSDAALTFIAWAKKNPKLHDQLAVEGVMQAVGQRWPCTE